MFIRALEPTNLKSFIHKQNQVLIFITAIEVPAIREGLCYLSVKLLSAFEHVLNQRAVESIHVESSRIIGICIVTVLGSL